MVLVFTAKNQHTVLYLRNESVVEMPFSTLEVHRINILYCISEMNRLLKCPSLHLKYVDQPIPYFPKGYSEVLHVHV